MSDKTTDSHVTLNFQTNKQKASMFTLAPTLVKDMPPDLES